MKLVPIFLIIFGLIVIAMPEILAYLLGGLFIFLGINGLILGGLFNKMKGKSAKSAKSGGEDYVQFGKYKIFK